MQYLLIYCTCPDQPTAEQLARQLVENQLAACVNIFPSLTSIYRWQNQIETANELLLLIKTRADKYSALETWIKNHHPYEVPEIIATPIIQGLPSYLDWIVKNT